MALGIFEWFDFFSVQGLLWPIDAAKVTIIVVLLFSTIKYFMFPLDWTKDIHDSGYAHVKKSGYQRLNKINSIRRTRTIGNIPPVFPNGWFMLAESHQVKSGTPLHVNALGEDFVIFRGANNKCHILDAFCPHLGANMGIGGRVVGDCIECPFHRWQFKGDDGKCTKIPYTDKVPTFAKVRHWKSLELNDMIFVWYHAEGCEPLWAPEEIPEIEKKIFTFCGRNEFRVNAHIQEIPENGCDLWHFNAIHGKSFVCGSDIRSSRHSWSKFMTHVWSSDWEPSTHPDKTHVAYSKLKHHISLFGFKISSFDVNIRQYARSIRSVVFMSREREEDWVVVLEENVPLSITKGQVPRLKIGPAYVELKFSTPLGIVIMTQAVTPMEPLVQRVIHRVYTRSYFVLYGLFVIVGESIMVERDIMVWNNKKYMDKPLLVKEDRLISIYRRWFAQFFSPNSPTYSQVKAALEW